MLCLLYTSILIGIFLPILLIFIIGYGVSLDVKNVPIAVVLEDTSPTTYNVLSFLNGSEYFSPTYVTSMHEAEKMIDERHVDAILRIPSDFSESLYRQESSIQLILYGVDSSTATPVSYTHLDVYKRQALGISQAKLLPWLDSNNGWERKKTSDNSPNPSGIANVYKLGIDASWEIDIFGGNQYKIEAATADLQTQHAQLHSAWVTLTSEVAINYLSLRTLQERLSIAEANLALQEDTVQLLQSKYNNGLIDGLVLNQAKYTASPVSYTHLDVYKRQLFSYL